MISISKACPNDIYIHSNINKLVDKYVKSVHNLMIFINIKIKNKILNQSLSQI